MIELSPVAMIFLISAAVSLIISLIYKFSTNQEELKYVNEKLKELNPKLKESQKNKDQKELMKLQGQMLELNNKKMKNSMKPMLITFVIIIPVFVYLLPSLYGDLNVELDESMNGVMKFNDMEKNLHFSEDPVILDINGKEISSDEVIYLGDDRFMFKNFDKGKNTIGFKRVAVEFPFSWPIWGSHIGWLGWYILVSITMTSVFRKALGVVQ